MGSDVILDLTTMTPSGECIGRHDGVVVFVPFTLPGERARVEVVHRRTSFARARLIEVLQPAPERVAPPCPHFTRCGGCDWQHIEYAAQVRFKTEIVREQLARIGHIADAEVRACLPCPHPYGYRNRVQLVRSDRGRLGYRARSSHDVTEIDACPIADPRINAALAAAADGPPGESVDLRVDDGPDARVTLGRAGGAEGGSTLTPDEAPLTLTVAGLTYRVSPGAFFQVNTTMAEVLVREVLAALAIEGQPRVLDLFCGVGLFAAQAAARGARVLGIESSPAAAEDARHNLRAFAPRAEVVTADVRAALVSRRVARAAWDRVIVDPPRAGLAAPAVAALAGLTAGRIVYVSCEPATLARDAAALIQRGYRLDYAQPLDLFPQTRHVETVALFTRPATA